MFVISKEAVLKPAKKFPMVIAIAAILAVSAILPAAAQAAYDRDVVVQVMRSNVQTLGQVRAALAKGDFYAAAEGFWKFAEGQNRIMQFTPPKGSKAEWDRVLGKFVDTALRGVGAAGERDSAKGLKIVEELQALNKEGHSIFR